MLQQSMRGLCSLMLEEKVGTLQSKPCKMPYEKEELLNAAICRVDALEAELIATKKALYEALVRQEELLAYIDSQDEIKQAFSMGVAAYISLVNLLRALVLLLDWVVGGPSGSCYIWICNLHHLHDFD